MLLTTLLSSLHLIPDGTTHRRRGLSHLAAHRWEEAREDFMQATRMDPASAVSWQDLACVQIRLGRYDEALVSAQQFVELAPPADKAAALFNRALVKAHLNQMQAAGDDYTEVVRLDPACAPAWQALTLIHMRAGQTSVALAYAEMYTELCPLVAAGWHRLAECQYREGQYVETLASIRRVLHLHPGHVKAQHNLRLLQSRLAHGTPLQRLAQVNPAALLQQWYAGSLQRQFAV